MINKLLATLLLLILSACGNTQSKEEASTLTETSARSSSTEDYFTDKVQVQ